MKLKANHLVRRSEKDTFIKEQVREIINSLEKTIQRAFHDEKTDCARDELPTSFPTSGLRPDEAQTLIYSRVIGELQEAGYTVRLYNPDDDHVMIKIQWKTDSDRARIRDMENNLAKLLINEHEYRRD